MKYFLLFIIGALFLEQCMELVYKRTAEYKNSQGGAERFRKGVPSELEIVNIGSGPGLYAISYEKCKWKGFNFSTAPQNYKYGFRILKRFQKHIKSDAIIIIIIMCPLSFGKNKDYDLPGYSNKFYGILPREDIDNFSYVRAMLLKMPLLMKMLRKVKKKNEGGQKQEAKEKQPGEPPLIATWKWEFGLTDLKDPMQVDAHREAFKEKVRILEDGIAFCKGSSWNPIFVIPPVPLKTREYISDDFLDCFVYQNLKEIMSDYPDIPLLDYYSDSRFEADMFDGDIFMNEKGKTAFSEILFKEIEEGM